VFITKKETDHSGLTSKTSKTSLTSLRGHRYSSISTSDSSLDETSGFGFHRGYSTICTPRARALLGRSALLLEHLTALSGLSIPLSTLSTDCTELDRLTCMSPDCSVADTDLSVNIPESELTTTGLLFARSELFEKRNNLEVTVAELLTSEVAEVELAARCVHDHANDNVAD